MRAISILLLFPVLASGGDQDLRRIWPSEIPFPVGITTYQRTEYAQYLAVNGLNGHNDVLRPIHESQDQPFANSEPARNPNRTIARWTAPGGLQDIPRSEYRSILGVYLPGRIISWRGPISVGNAPSGYLLKELVYYPSGTIFVDALVNKEGRLFELRERHKLSPQEGWESNVLYKNPTARPAGYRKAPRCATCHDQQTGDNGQYFINLRRQDGVFSLPVFQEGTLIPDFKRWPIERR